MMKNKHFILKIIIIIILTLVTTKRGYSIGKYYSILGIGAGYREFIVEDASYRTSFISPYFEYGAGSHKKTLIGFNGMIALNTENTSQITLFQIGGQAKYFIVPRTFFIGGGPALNIEGENVEKKDVSSENSGITIENPKIFFNVNLHTGITFPLFKGYFVFLDTFASLSTGRPYQYSLNMIIGLLSFY